MKHVFCRFFANFVAPWNRCHTHLICHTFAISNTDTIKVRYDHYQCGKGWSIRQLCSIWRWSTRGVLASTRSGANKLCDEWECLKSRYFTVSGGSFHSDASRKGLYPHTRGSKIFQKWKIMILGDFHSCPSKSDNDWRKETNFSSPLPYLSPSSEANREKVRR